MKILRSSELPTRGIASFARERLAARSGAGQSNTPETLLDFIPHLSPAYSSPRHLTPLTQRLEAAVAGQRQRVLCCAPPRHAKTETLLHAIAFALARHPRLVFAYATYGDRLARSKSRRARVLAERAGVRLEAKAVNEWRTVLGGGLLASGVGGPLTGHGVDILVVDDPAKNRLEAESRAHRESLTDWFHDVAASRVEPNGSIFVFATRWTPDDLIGVLSAEGGWENISLPALSGDAALWPERWPVAELEAKRRDVGEYTWASLYQGEPRPRGGRVFEDVYTFIGPPNIYVSAIGLDLAYSAKTSADASVAVLMARDSVGRCYLLDAIIERVPPAVFKRRLAVLCRAHPAASVHWYASGTEMGAAAFLREPPDEVPLVASPARGDKFIRAIAYAAAWNRGEVLLPREGAWVSRVVAEHASFTGADGGEDDIVDACVAAWDALVMSSERIVTRPPRTKARGLMAESM